MPRWDRDSIENFQRTQNTIDDALDTSKLSGFVSAMDSFAKKMVSIGDIISQSIGDKFNQVATRNVQDIKKMESELENLERKGSESGSKFGSGFIQSMDMISKKMISIVDTISAYFSDRFNKIATRNDVYKPKHAKEAVEEAKQEAQAVQEVAKAREEANAQADDSKKPLRGHTREYDIARSETQKAKESRDARQKDVDYLKERIAEYRDLDKQGKITPGDKADYDKMLSQLPVEEAKLKHFEQEYQRLLAIQQKLESEGDGKAFTRNYAALEQDIANKKQALQQLKDNVHKSENVDADAVAMKALEQEIAKLEKIKAQLDKGTQTEQPQGKQPQGKQPNANTPQAQTEQENEKLHGLLGTLKEVLSVRMQLASAKTGLPFSSDAEASQAHIKGLEGRLKGLQTILSSMKGAPAIQAITGAFSAVGSAAKTAVGHLANFARQGLDAIISGAQRVGSALASVASTGFHALVSSAQGAVSAFNALNSGARSVISTIASLASKGFGALKTGIGAAISGVQGLIGKFKSLSGDATKKLSHSIMSIKSMLIRRIKRTFITSIFNQAKEGLQEFARYSDTFNQSMSSIKNGAKEAAGNMAVTLGNLVNLIAPALNTLLSLLSSVFQAINSIFALLGGKSTVTTAKKSTDNYAKSLKSAGGAAKDLNHQLYGFDEITRQEDNSGGGGGGSKIGYEESAINENLKSIFDKIKEAWEASEYEKVGMLIAEQLNNIIYTIDDFFIAIRPKAVEWASNIARVLNGLVEGWDAWATGKMLGDGLNLILDTVNTFLKTFKAMRFGEKLAEMLNGLFDTVEWDLLGETVAQYFSTIWRVLAGLVKDAKWKEYGQKLGTAVNSFFANFDFEAMRNTIVNGINGLVDSLMNFIQTVEVDKITKQLASNIRRIITRIQWKKMGEMFATYINSAITGASNLFDSKSISLLGRNIGVALKNTLDNVNWTKLGKTAAKGLAEIQKAFTNFVDAIDLPNLGRKLATGIQSMFDNIDWDARKQMVTTSVNDVFKGIGNAIRGVRWNEFAQQAANNANSIIEGIEWTEIGKTLSDGINAAFGSLSTFVNTFKWGDLGSRVASGLQTFAENINWEDVRGTISGFINGLTDLFTNFVDGVNWTQIATDVTSNLDTLITTDINWENISGLLSKSVNGLIDIFDTLVTSDTIVHLADKLGGLANNFLSKIDWEKLGTDLRLGLWKLIWGFKSFTTRVNFPEIAGKIAGGVNAFFDPSKGGGDLGSLAKTATDGINNVISGFKAFVKGDSALGIDGINFEQIEGELAAGIGSLIKETDWKSLIDTVGTLVKEVASAFFKIVGAIFEKNENGQTLGGQIADGLNSLFKIEGTDEIDLAQFEQFGESIGEAISNIIENIDQFMTQLDVDAIIESLTTVFQKINFGELIVKILKLIGDAALKIGDAIPELLAGILHVVNTIPWFDVVCAILEAIGKVAFSAINAVGGLIGKFFEWVFGTGEFDEVPQIIDDDMVAQLQEQAGEAGKSMVGAFADSSVEAYNQFAEEFGENTAKDWFWGAFNPDENEQQKQVLLQAAAAMGMGFQEEYKNALLASGKFEESDYSFLAHEAELLISEANDNIDWQQTQVDWANAGITITNAFAQAITHKGKEDIGAALALLGAGVSEETIAAFDVEHLHEVLMGFMNSTGLDLQQTVAFLSGATKEEIAQLTGETAQEVGEKLGNITPEALAKALAEGKVLVKEASDELAESATQTTENAEGARQGGEATGKASGEGTQEAIDNSKEGVGKSVEGVVEEIVDKFDKGKGDVETSVANVNKTIDEKIKELPEEQQKNAKKMMDMMVEGILEGDPLVQEAIGASALATVQKVEELLSGAKGREIVKSFLDGMKAEIDNTFASKVSDTLAYLSADAVVDVAGRLSSDNGYTIINWFLDGMQSGITQNFNAKVLDTLGEALSGVFTLLNSVDWGNAGYKVTFNLLEGMNEAILRNDDTLVANIQRMCQAMVDTAKEVFDEHSPSRVFNQIGSYVMEGMENGLLDSGKDAISAVSEVAQAMIEEGNGVKLQASFDTMNSGLDVATDKLTQLANIFSNIAETLVEMGGLHIPTIATGQSIPYRTQLGATHMNGFGTSDNPHALEDALYNAFTRAMGSSGAEQDINITLSVDGRKMADIVSKYQRQQGRAWGV